MKTLDRPDPGVRPLDPVWQADRTSAKNAFEQALQGSDGQHDGQQGEQGGQDARALLHNALTSLQRSMVDLSVPAHAPTDATSKRLAREIGAVAQSAQHTNGGRWRLLMRLPEEVMALSEIDMACQPGHLRIALRTASAQSYELLCAARPELDQALSDMQVVADPVQVVLINRLDLS